MKFNIVSVRSDTFDESASFYDCPSKNTFTLVRINNELKWLRYKPTKANIDIKFSWPFGFGGPNGIIHIPHREDLFSFDKKEIKKLNELSDKVKRTKTEKNKFKLESDKQNLLVFLRSQMKEFLQKEIKN